MQGSCYNAERVACSSSHPTGVCPTGYRCNAGVCEAEATEPCSPTVPNGTCSGSALCVDGTCQEPELDLCSAIYPSGACPVWAICVAGNCVPLNGEENLCSPEQPDGLCPDAKRCVDGACVPITQDEACSPQHPAGVCTGGAECIQGECVFPDCDSEHPHGACPPSYVCHQGECQQQPCAPLYPEGFCPDNRDCQQGYCACDTTCADSCISPEETCDDDTSSPTCGQCICDTTCKSACTTADVTCDGDANSPTCGQCICDTTCGEVCVENQEVCDGDPDSPTCGQCACDTTCNDTCVVDGQVCDEEPTSATCGQCVCDTTCSAEVCIRGESCDVDTNSMTCGQCVCGTGITCAVSGNCCTTGEVCINDRYCRAPCPDDKYCGVEAEICCGPGEVCGASRTCEAECPPNQQSCGADRDYCCDAGQACIYDSCLQQGVSCTDFLDCDFGQYCEPTLGHCLPTDIGGGESCKFEPPPGIFDPAIEWNWGGVYLGCAVQGSFDCADGDCAILCDGDGDCAGGSCVEHRCTCSANSDCDESSGQRCAPAPNNICVQGSTSCGNYYQNVMAIPSVADMDLDGVPEVMFRAYQGDSLNQSIFLILDGRDGGNGTGAGSPPKMIYAQPLNGSPPWNYTNVPWLFAAGHQAAVNLDDDDELEVVAVAATGLVSFNDIADGLDTSDGDGVVLWTQASAPLNSTLDGGAPTVADLNGDGRVEVIFGTAVLDGPTGTILAENGTSGGGSRFTGGWIAIVADIDLDGAPEQITGNRAYDITFAAGTPGCVANPTDPGCWTQTLLWEQASHEDGFSAVANFYNNPQGGVDYPEVVNVVNGNLYIYDGLDGDLLFGPIVVPAGLAGANHGGPPNISDFDGDGRPEVATAGSGCYAVYDVDCAGDASTRAAMPPGCAAPAVDNCGNDSAMVGVLWNYLAQDTSSACTGSSVFDFQGDGIAEVLYNDECFFRVFDGPSGDVLLERPNSSRTNSEYPMVVDVDGDRSSEIVLIANRDQLARDCCVNNDSDTPEDCSPYRDAGIADYMGNSGESLSDPGEFCDLITYPENTDLCTHGTHGITVYGDTSGRWVKTRPIWHQHAYHATDVLLDNATSIATIATTETNSWDLYNNYRQNVQGFVPLNAPNLMAVSLVADLSYCPPEVTLLGRIANGGSRGYDPQTDGQVPVSFYVDDGSSALVHLTTVWVDQVIPPGSGLTLELGYTLLSGVTPILIMVVNDDGGSLDLVAECNADDNTAYTSAIQCGCINIGELCQTNDDCCEGFCFDAGTGKRCWAL